MMETSEPRKPIGGIVAAVGGVLAIVGSIMTWATVETDLFGTESSTTVSGLEGGDGKITLVLGIILLIAGVLVLVAKAAGLRRGMAIVAIIAGLVCTGVSVFDVVDIKANSVDQLIEELGGDPDTITDEQRKQVEDTFKVSVGIGLYLTLLGGLVGLVGGIMSVRQGPAAAMPLAAPPPPPMSAADPGAVAAPPPATPLGGPPAEPPAPPPAPPLSGPPAEPPAPPAPPAGPPTEP